MIDLNLGMFITPFVALTGVISLYVYFLKKTADKSAFRRFMGTVAVSAFLLNYGWELSHCTLYQDFVYDEPHIAFLALASLADTIMTGLLYFGFALVYQQGLWIHRLTTLRVFGLVLAGVTGAIGSEIAHLSAGNWAYTDEMPIIPGIGVGLTPVLQFTVLPILIYSLSFYLSTLKVTPSASPAWRTRYKAEKGHRLQESSAVTTSDSHVTKP